MVLDKKRLTIDDFDRFVNLPENEDKLFEFIAGEIVEVPSNAYASEIAANILFFIKLFLRQMGLKGHVTEGQGGFMVSGEKYAPDVAYISYERQPELAREGYNPNPPELAVEVDFPSTYESQKKLRTKVANYLAAGTLIWVVLPESQEVEVYAAGQPMKLVGVDGILDGGDVLPEFTLPVKDIFPA